MKRSRSGQCGSAASNFRCRVNSAVAASAMPIGIPGWPLLAASTASIASARMALARRRWVGCIKAPAMGFGAALGLAAAARFLCPVSRWASMLAAPDIFRVTGSAMDDSVLNSAFDRAEAALQRIERALANRQPAGAGRDEELRAKVREVVEELDELIRQ